MVILDKSKPISLILKIKLLKIQKSEICTLHIYYSLKLKLDRYTTHSKIESTSFMFNNIFCEMKGKKVIDWGGPGGNWGTVLISSWKCNFSIYLDIQVYYLDIQPITTLLCLLLVLWVGSFYSFTFLCYNHSPEKWRFWHSKHKASPSFGPTRMVLGTFWRGMKCGSIIIHK